MTQLNSTLGEKAIQSCVYHIVQRSYCTSGLIHRLNADPTVFHLFVHTVYRLLDRVECFWRKKNVGTWHVVVHCSGTSNSKFYYDLLLFHLAHGKTRLQKTPKIPKKGLKSAHTQILFDIFKGFTWNKICSLFDLIAKKEEKLEEKFCFTIF